jgi:dihydroorotate dehydrogenase (fumarate)
MSALASRYLSLDLAHPVIASASPLTATFDGLRRLEDAGAAAVVVASLYEEEIRAADAAYATLTEETAGCHPEAAGYFPELPDYRYGVSGHLELVRRAAEALSIPVIASLNGVSNEGWLDFAVQLELAGAAALELDLYLLPTDFGLSGSDIERQYLDIVRHVKRSVRIPVSVNLPPFFSAVGNFCKQLEAAGADGLVLFHRSFRPDIDIDTRTVTAEPVLSSRAEMYVPLTWTALLSGCLDLSLAAAGGVDTHVEVVKFLLAGADVVATTSALMRHGPQYMTALIEGLKKWLADHGYESVSELRGDIAGARAVPIDTFLRTQYTHFLGKHSLPFLKHGGAPLAHPPLESNSQTWRANGARRHR